MDVVTAARFQGPGLRAQGLVMAALILLSSAAFAVFRIARDGAIDGVTTFWIVLAIGTATGLAALELSANRSLSRAARAAALSADEYIVLFRYGQVVGNSATSPTTINKGWINLSEEGLTILAFRRRQIVGRYWGKDIASVDVVSAPRAYAVIEISFKDGSRFQAIPVETGMRNLGLSHDRVARLALEILRWRDAAVSR